MGNIDHDRTTDEVERLRQALDAETQRCLDLQRQLSRANSEFEEFVSTASHDLREFLRGVASYSQLLAQDYSGRLDSDAVTFLEHIQADTARMQALLTGMVDYWATNTSDRQPERTDMEAVLTHALLLTDKLMTERGATVTHDPLPVIMGDSGILTKVLHHLVRNAIEYCVSAAPRVHVSCRRSEPDWVFSVADNGPGIDPAYHTRIFGVFRRLQGREHPGNGLGLAFCKKAIEHHGGRMWVESTPDVGSTFCFSLPSVD